ncbi:hypothetical protein [Pseudomonas sp. S3E12]|jgi:hypothetical protein|uniref:hypothetical protein n=1 Tax=Pseudomonas sp. S3E12 TaxID=1873126 RepID=UPI0009F5F5E9|nr:hypothetical protein [Pseudomonas sp. S3E12]
MKMSNCGDLLDDNLGDRSKFPSEFAGQKLFVRGDDWQNNAMLGWAPYSMDIYAAGYKDAADAILYALSERRTSLDSVIYPLVFLYRQGLELQIKLILALARQLANSPAKEDHSHSLMPMWAELRTLLNELTPHACDQEVPAMEQFLHQLAEIDPQSFSFRYPEDKKGQLSLPDLHHINVRHLSEVMDSMFMLLSGIHSELGEMDQHVW